MKMPLLGSLGPHFLDECRSLGHINDFIRILYIKQIWLTQSSNLDKVRLEILEELPTMKLSILTIFFCLLLCSSHAMAQAGKGGPAPGQTGISAPPMPVEDSKPTGVIVQMETSKYPPGVSRRRNALGGKPIFSVMVKKGQVLEAHTRCAEFAIADILDQNNKTLKKHTFPKIEKSDTYVMQADDVDLSKPVVMASDQEKSRKSAFWELEEVFGTAPLVSSDEDGEEVALAHFQIPIEYHNLNDDILARVTQVECTINPRFFGPHHPKNLRVMNPEGAVIISDQE